MEFLVICRKVCVLASKFFEIEVRGRTYFLHPFLPNIPISYLASIFFSIQFLLPAHSISNVCETRRSTTTKAICTKKKLGRKHSNQYSCLFFSFYNFYKFVAVPRLDMYVRVYVRVYCIYHIHPCIVSLLAG